MKHLVLAASLAAISCAAFAQTAVTSERTETRVETTNGGVTTVQTSVVVREYVTYLYDVYVAVGVPRAQIVQLIDIDLQILEARIALNFDLVRTLVRRQTEIVSVPVVQKIHTYVVSHRPPTSIPVYAQPVWVNNVNVVNNEVNIEINETEVRNAVQSSNVKVESLNIDQAKQAVSSGKIEQLKASSSTDTKAATDAKADTDADAANTPAAGETPRAGEKPASRNANTPDANATRTPSANETPSATDSDSDATPTPTTRGAQPNPTRPEDRTDDTRGANPDPSAPPANASERARERSNSPNMDATPAAGSTATPSSSSATPSSSSSATPASNQATPISSTQRSNPNQSSNNAVQRTPAENVRDSSNPSSTPTPSSSSEN